MKIDTTKPDIGHYNLLQDIKRLQDEAEHFDFHDGKSNRAEPKGHLVNLLKSMLVYVKYGVYDN